MALLQNVIARGTHAARPAAGSAGVLYVENDTGRIFRDNGTTWDALDVMTTAGDLLYFDGANLKRLGIGASGQTLVVAAGEPEWGAVALTTTVSYLTGDVTMTTHDVFYDGPSVSLAAGTWLVVAQVTVHLAGANSNITGKLWDGTTVTSSVEAVGLATGDLVVPVSGIVSPGSTTTFKVSVTGRGTDGNTIKATQTDNNSGCTNKASYILAVRLA